MRACYRKVHNAVAELQEVSSAGLGKHAVDAFSVGLEALVPVLHGPVLDFLSLLPTPGSS